MTPHYSVKRDERGWTVFDRWTGETVVLALRAQSGLSQDDAEHLVEQLNRRGPEGNRTILQ
jgi:hypothetical protein